MHTYIHTCIHTYMHTCIHAYIHTYTYIYTYTLEYIFHTHCTLLIHMKHGETALEHHRARLRKRHKSRCPRYTSSTVCQRCLMMFFFCRPANLAMKFKTKSACCETAESCSLSIIAPQLFPNPAEIGVVQTLRKLASSPEV
jgi:hypothetical protein